MTRGVGQSFGRLVLVFVLVSLGVVGPQRVPKAASASTVKVGPVTEAAADRTCSLVEAIALVDALLQGQNVANDCGVSRQLRWPLTIVLAANHVYVLNSDPTGGDDQTAFPVVSGASRRLIVEGNGATIERSSPGPPFRFFAVRDQGSLEIRDLTLMGGEVDRLGGAIECWDSTLTVVESTLQRNGSFNPFTRDVPREFTSVIAGWGGAIGIGRCIVTIERSTFKFNIAERRGGAIGGFSLEGSLTIVDSTFIGNWAKWTGGAISDCVQGFGGPIRIVRSSFLWNSAAAGGAMYACVGDLVVSESVFADNEAREGGAVSLVNGETHEPRKVTFLNTTFSGNRARSGSAIEASRDVLVDLAFVTFADQAGGPSLVPAGPEGTLFRLRNVVLADPLVDACDRAQRGRFEFSGRVLVDDDSCGTGGAVVVVPTLRDSLSDLRKAGGTTAVHELLAGSPAIAAVPADACTDHEGKSVVADQRGKSRPNPLGTRCDAGAVESELGGGAVSADLRPHSLDHPSEIDAGQPFTVVIGVSNDGGVAVPGATVALAISADEQRSEDDFPLGGCTLQVVPSRGSASCSIESVLLPAVGNYFMVVEVKPPPGVVDPKLENNQLASPVEPMGLRCPSLPGVDHDGARVG